MRKAERTGQCSGASSGICDEINQRLLGTEGKAAHVGGKERSDGSLER